MFTELWFKIIQDAKIAGEFGSTLSLTCMNHGKVAEVTAPQDFQAKSPAGKLFFKCRGNL